MPISASQLPALVSVPAQGFGLLMLQGFLEDALGGEPDYGPDQLLPIRSLILATSQLGHLLRFDLTRRYLPWHTGGSFLLVVKRSDTTLTFPEKGLSSHRYFYRDYRT